jgi:hypothetical protein
MLESTPNFEDYTVKEEDDYSDRFKKLYLQKTFSYDDFLPFGKITSRQQLGYIQFFESPMNQIIQTSKYHEYFIIKGLQWNQGFDDRFVDIWVLVDEIPEE